ncbi:tetratricopeptide repeat protein [Peribacillus sp. SCS-155]|uniref:tetratricopeptide repeat protein n=1 Tax=Peribacillus sedimenti TaxID=3115297 RepID=UPI0039057632
MKWFVSTAIAVLLFATSGIGGVHLALAKNTGEPAASVQAKKHAKQIALEQFLALSIQKKHDKAYGYLSKVTQKRVSKNNYVKVQRLYDQYEAFTSFKVSLTKNPNQLKVTFKAKNFYDNKVYSNYYIQQMRYESGKWKVDLSGLDWASALSEAYLYLGVMYYDGKGKPKNVKEAMKHFNLSLAAKKTFWGYFFLGHANLTLNKPKESIAYFENSLNFPAGNADKAVSVYNIAYAYYVLGDFANAEAYAEQSLQLDPNYQQAKDLLAEVQKGQ